jgi:DNA repair protein RadA/Sms
MVKKVIYVCSNCGYTTSKWLGRCPSCQQWGTFEEKTAESTLKKPKSTYKKPQKIVDVNEIDESISIDKDFDTFLFKGIVRGGVYLISGTPGVGKSTLLLQVSQKLTKNGARVVYVSAEESINQVSMRAKRLDASDMYVLSDNDIDSIIYMAESELPDVLIVDSIHTVYSKELDAVAGGVQQVRYAAERIIELAKKKNIAVIIVAHVTKDGAIAGPKMLEHMVDSVLFLDGEDEYRVLRLQKNRFGPTDESLIMEMKNEGLRIVDDPTVKFIDDKQPSEGRVYGMVVEGRYPIVVEIQALCVETPLAIPRRVSVGFDLNRLNMLLAVIEKKLKIPMFKYDVYLNIAGGVKISSTLVDICVVSSVISSIKKKVLSKDIVMVGEFDLSGNIRLLEKFAKHVEKIKQAGFDVVSPSSGVDDIFKLIKKINSAL